MQRRAYAPGLAALLAALTAAGLLGGCSSGSDADGSADHSKTGGATDAGAAPGRYQGLYEPCGSVPRSQLEGLLPGVVDLPAEQRDRVLRGTAARTYDSDRRAGCSWKADGEAATYHLTLDFERVVSYDPEVSDDDRAQEVFAGKEAAAGLPARTPGTPASTGGSGTSASGGASASAAEGQQAQTGQATPAPSSSPGSSASASPSASPTTPDGLQPRALDGLGDVAFLDDVLAPAGPAAQQRTVSVVFRTSNVIVTVRYAAQPARVGEVPDSEELQDKAQGVARTLAERFED